MNITAKMEVIIEEMMLDFKDFLSNFIGEVNDDLTRSTIASITDAYFAQNDEIQIGQCICDASNNPPAVVDNSELIADLLVVVDGISFRLHFVVTAGALGYSEISSEAFVRTRVDPVSTFTPIEAPKLHDEKYAEMPAQLASTLGY